MVRDRDHYTVIRDFFELSAISIRNNFDHGNEYANLEKRYMEIAQGYKKEYLEGWHWLLESQEWATSSMSVERLLLTTQGQ